VLDYQARGESGSELDHAKVAADPFDVMAAGRAIEGQGCDCQLIGCAQVNPIDLPVRRDGRQVDDAR
jgi:hypothetical protein